jgi:N-methylhydantoinase A
MSPGAGVGAGARPYRIGVDIGGTFTDLTLADAEGIVAVGKVLTVADEPARGVEEVIRVALDQCGIDASQLAAVVHGTTLVTNAIIERNGARTALLSTDGFRDVVEIGRERRYELYDLMIDLPRPLVPRHLRFDVPERTLADGHIECEVDVELVERLASELQAAGIEAVAVAFLHSYANAANERATRDAIRRAAPEVRVALSSEIVPEIREYERTSTTIASVYVQDRVDTYLSDLERRLRKIGLEGPLYVMLSNGGVATVETAKQFPIRILESGPAAGALAASAIGSEGNRDELVSFDMGGTTAKMCMIEGGEPRVTQDFEVDRVYRLRPGSGLPIKTPVIDMIEIGVGGGSIARIDALGLLRIGPTSAGSDPGPVCYGRGGSEPTVTDADLVLGYLDPHYFLGGRITLDFEAARRVLRQRIAKPLGVSLEEAAWGIHRSVNEDMANALRVHVVERGHDPRGLAMYAFGGAGPVHGAGVAQAAGCPLLVAPADAGVMSSAGLLAAPLAFDFVRSRREKLNELSTERMRAAMAEMEQQGVELLRASGVADSEITHARYADMRYIGQGSEIRVPVPERGEDWLNTLRTAFEGAYQQLYGRGGPDIGIEVINWRVVSSGPRPSLRIRRRAAATSPTARKGTRPAYFGEFVETDVYDRYALEEGAAIDGPAIVEEQESTLVVPPAASVMVEASLALAVEFRGKRS